MLSSSVNSNTEPFACDSPFCAFPSDERVAFLFFGTFIESPSPLGIAKVVGRPRGFFSGGASSSSRSLGFLPLFAVGTGAGACTGAGSEATGSVFVLFDPRVKTKSPSSSSYAVCSYQYCAPLKPLRRPKVLTSKALAPPSPIRLTHAQRL